MSMRWTHVWALFALVFFFGQDVLAQEITLHLRNGDRISGKVVTEQAEQVILDTAWQKGLVVPIGQIERREVKPQVETPPAAPPVAAAPVPEVAPPAAPPVQPPQPGFWQRWHGELEVGLDFIRSEKDRDLLYGRSKFTYVQNRFRESLDYQAAYGKTDGVLSANRMDGSTKTDWDLNPKLFVYNLGAAGYDRLRKIDYQYEIGPGLGYHVFARTNFVLNAESGFSYNETAFSNAPKREDATWRLAEDLTWKVNSKIIFEEKMAFMPRLDDFSAYRLRLEGTLKFLVLQNLSLNFTLMNLFDSRPAPGISRNDLQIRSTLGVRF